MNWSEEAIRKDISRYLEGSISVNELIELTDEAMDWLRRNYQEEPSEAWQRAWVLGGSVENLLGEYVHEYIDKAKLNEVLTELHADSFATTPSDGVTAARQIGRFLVSHVLFPC